MKSAGKARSNGLYRHIRTSKEIIKNLLNYYRKKQKTKSTGTRDYTVTCTTQSSICLHTRILRPLRGA